MRLKKFISALFVLAATGCSGVQFSRGLPVIAKSTDGLLIRDTGGLPDLERGRQARLSGRLDDAQRDLLPLARRGYPDAQMNLAAVFGQIESTHAQDQAILWYRTVLPRRPDAGIPLARMYMRQGARDSVLEAERLLLQAHDEPAAGAALLDLYALFPLLDVEKHAPELAEVAAVSASADLRIAAINWYRASLADPGHARRLLQLCRENLDAAPLCFVDLATYYRYTGDALALDAVVTEAMTSLRRTASTDNFDRFDYDPIALPPIAGRIAVALVEQPAVEDLVEVSEDLTLEARAETQVQTTAADESVDATPVPDTAPQYADVDVGGSAPPPGSVGTAHPELADRLLRWMLEQPGAMPVEAAGVAVAFPYLLPDVDLEAVLSSGVSAGVPSASLYLGLLYYYNQRTPRDALRVEQNLKRSLEFRETAASGHFRLGRLYQQGYLGRPDPRKALDHFLYAARRRVTAADTHLARLFYDTPGVRIDRVNSYVFARLAEEGGNPVFVHSLRSGVLSAYKLLDRLGTELTAQELQQAESLYEREKEVHRVARPRVAPDLWVKEAG